MPLSELDTLYSDVNILYTLNQKGSLLRGIDAINQSIYSILTTPIGTRYRRPTYGSYIPFLLQELPTDTYYFELKNYAITAIQNWEPRVQVLRDRVDVKPLESSNAHAGVSVVIPYFVPRINYTTAFAADFAFQ